MSKPGNFTYPVGPVLVGPDGVRDDSEKAESAGFPLIPNKWLLPLALANDLY